MRRMDVAILEKRRSDAEPVYNGQQQCLSKIPTKLYHALQPSEL